MPVPLHRPGWLVLALAVAAAPASAAAVPAPRRTSLLFGAVDDLHRWAGYPRCNSPTTARDVDRFARVDVAFHLACSVAPADGPARGAVARGEWPRTTGLHGHAATRKSTRPERGGITRPFQLAGHRVSGPGKIRHGASHFLIERTDRVDSAGHYGQNTPHRGTGRSGDVDAEPVCSARKKAGE